MLKIKQITWQSSLMNRPEAVKNLNVQNVQYDVANALPSPPLAARKIDKSSILFLPNLSTVLEITAPNPIPIW